MLLFEIFVMSAPRVPSTDKNHPRMRRVDLSSDLLTSNQREMIDSYNKVQYEKYRKQFGYKNRIYGLALGGLVLSIYGYTLYQMSKDKDLVGEMEKEVMEFDKK